VRTYVDEIDPRGHFTHAFFIRKCFEQLFSSHSLVIKKFWPKSGSLNVNEN